MSLTHSVVKKQCRWKWTARLAANRHISAKLERGDDVVHAIIQLRGTVEGSPTFGKIILIGCSCNALFWRNLKCVPDYQVEGDWASPFRNQLGIKGQAYRRSFK